MVVEQYCWCTHGIWKFLYAGYSQYTDMQQTPIDSTITRAYACAAGVAGKPAKKMALGQAGRPLILNRLKFIDFDSRRSNSALLGNQGYDRSVFIQRLSEMGLSPPFHHAATGIIKEIVIGSRIKSVT